MWVKNLRLFVLSFVLMIGMFVLTVLLTYLFNENGGVVLGLGGEPTCYTSLDESNTTLSISSDATAVQTAVNAVAENGTVKIAGTCEGVLMIDGTIQTVRIEKSITLKGGYDHTNWAAGQQVEQFPTFLEANNLGHVVFVTGTHKVLLDGLAITGGRADEGGGIQNHSELSLNNVQIGINRANVNGGGIYSTKILTVSNSVFIDNRATFNGGAIFVPDFGDLNVTNTFFVSNRAIEGDGGAIDAEDFITVTIKNSSFGNNSAADQGGALYFEGDNFVYIEDSLFQQNSAGEDGGGTIS